MIIQNQNIETWQNYVIPSKRINVESTLKQRWSSTFINVVSTLIFGWKGKLSGRSFIDVVSRLAKQRWNNVDRITSMQRLWTKVVSTLKFGWEWKLNRLCLSTLFQHWQNNAETTMKELRRLNIDSMLFQRWYLVEKESWVNVCSSALRKEDWNNFVNICCIDDVH